MLIIFFDIKGIGVIKAESQAALNTITEHNFQNALKKWQRSWERYIKVEGDYFEGTCLVSTALDYAKLVSMCSRL
jgi:hypothetical protein